MKPKGRKRKYLNLYYKWLRRGKMDVEGLCMLFTIPDSDESDLLLRPITPTKEDELELLEQQGLHTGYWGSDDIWGLQYEFTPLRQNLLLLIACLNDEL